MKQDLIDLLHSYNRTLLNLRVEELRNRRERSSEEVTILEAKQDMAYEMANMLFMRLQQLKIIDTGKCFDEYRLDNE